MSRRLLCISMTDLGVAPCSAAIVLTDTEINCVLSLPQCTCSRSTMSEPSRVLCTCSQCILELCEDKHGNEIPGRQVHPSTRKEHRLQDELASVSEAQGHDGPRKGKRPPASNPGEYDWRSPKKVRPSTTPGGNAQHTQVNAGAPIFEVHVHALTCLHRTKPSHPNPTLYPRRLAPPLLRDQPGTGSGRHARSSSCVTARAP